MTIKIPNAALQKHSARMRELLREESPDATEGKLTVEEQQALDESLMRFAFHDGPRTNVALVGRVSSSTNRAPSSQREGDMPKTVHTEVEASASTEDV